jgi:hypothetical protein
VEQRHSRPGPDPSTPSRPRCTLFVFDPGFAWLALEATVTILDGADAAEHSLRLFREMQGKPTGPLELVRQRPG